MRLSVPVSLHCFSARNFFVLHRAPFIFYFASFFLFCHAIRETSADVILSVDFGVGDAVGNPGSPNDIAAGFFDFASPSGTQGNVDNYRTLAPISRIINNFQVQVERVGNSNGINYVDSADVTSAGGLNDLVEDYVSEFGLGLRISNLSPGSYVLQSYHHRPSAPVTTFEVYRSVGAAFSSVATVTSSTGTNPSQISTLSLTFSPDANGTVLFRYGNGLELGYLNGFTLTAVPEPSSIGLVAMTLAALLLCKRKKRA